MQNQLAEDRKLPGYPIASVDSALSVPDQVIRYVQGEFGTPPAPIDA